MMLALAVLERLYYYSYCTETLALVIKLVGDYYFLTRLKCQIKVSHVILDDRSSKIATCIAACLRRPFDFCAVTWLS